MRSFREHTIVKLSESAEDCSVRQGVDNQLNILRLRLIEASRLPELITENVIQQSEWLRAVNQDHQVQRYVIDNTIRFAQQTLYDVIEAAVEASAPSALDALRADIEAKVGEFVTTLKTTVGAGQKTSRGATGLDSEEAATPEIMPDDTPLGPSAEFDGGRGVPSSAADASSSRIPSSPPPEAERRAPVSSPPEEDDGPTKIHEPLPDGFSPAPRGSFTPGGTPGQGWWSKIGGGIKRAIIDPIMNWKPIKAFRRRWHGEEDRKMSQEQVRNFDLMLLENEQQVADIIDKWQTDFLQWLDARLDQISQETKIPYTRNPGSPQLGGGSGLGGEMPSSSTVMGGAVGDPEDPNVPVSPEEQQAKDQSQGTDPDMITGDSPVAQAAEQGDPSAEELLQKHQQNFDDGCKALGIKPMFGLKFSPEGRLTKSGNKTPLPEVPEGQPKPKRGSLKQADIFRFLSQQVGSEEPTAVPREEYPVTQWKNRKPVENARITNSAQLYAELLRRAYRVLTNEEDLGRPYKVKATGPKVYEMQKHLSHILGGFTLTSERDNIVDRMIELVLRVGAKTSGRDHAATQVQVDQKSLALAKAKRRLASLKRQAKNPKADQATLAAGILQAEKEIAELQGGATTSEPIPDTAGVGDDLSQAKQQGLVPEEMPENPDAPQSEFVPEPGSGLGGGTTAPTVPDPEATDVPEAPDVPVNASPEKSLMAELSPETLQNIQAKLKDVNKTQKKNVTLDQFLTTAIEREGGDIQKALATINKHFGGATAVEKPVPEEQPSDLDSALDQEMGEPNVPVTTGPEQQPGDLDAALDQEMGDPNGPEVNVVLTPDQEFQNGVKGMKIGSADAWDWLNDAFGDSDALNASIQKHFQTGGDAKSALQKVKSDADEALLGRNVEMDQIEKGMDDSHEVDFDQQVALKLKKDPEDHTVYSDIRDQIAQLSAELGEEVEDGFTDEELAGSFSVGGRNWLSKIAKSLAHIKELKGKLDTKKSSSDLESELDAVSGEETPGTMTGNGSAYVMPDPEDEDKSEKKPDKLKSPVAQVTDNDDLDSALDTELGNSQDEKKPEKLVSPAKPANDETDTPKKSSSPLGDRVKKATKKKQETTEEPEQIEEPEQTEERDEYEDLQDEFDSRRGKGKNNLPKFRHKTPEEHEEQRGKSKKKKQQQTKRRKSKKGRENDEGYFGSDEPQQESSIHQTIELYKKLLREGQRPSRSKVQELREQMMLTS